MKAFVWSFLFWLVSSTVIAAPIKNFTSGSYAQIVKDYQDEPFVMVLWSLDCPPCYKELAMLSNERKKYDFNLVLISVDGVDARNEVESVLKKYQLRNVDAWLFEEFSAQQLRYEIDPLWYGEMPRSYIFDKEHQQQALSGVLHPDQLPK